MEELVEMDDIVTSQVMVVMLFRVIEPCKG